MAQSQAFEGYNLDGWCKASSGMKMSSKKPMDTETTKSDHNKLVWHEAMNYSILSIQVSG